LPAPRVIFVNRVFWPNEAATAQLLTDLADALAARGWEVHIVAAGNGPTERGDIRIHRTGAESNFRPWRYAAFLHRARQRLRALVRPGDVVVVKTDPPMLTAAVTTLAHRRGARVVQWIQDIYPETLTTHLGPWSRPVLWPLRRARDAAWRESAACVTLGADMAVALRAAGVPPERTACLPNWAPAELETPARESDIAAVRAAWGVGDAFVVGYSGNFGRVHDVATFLYAAARLRDEPHVRFVFTGSGARWATVRDFVRTHQLTNVVLTPPQPRHLLAAALAAADAHLVTLRGGFESCVFPSKFAGILAAARPVLFIGPGDCELARICRAEQVGAVTLPGAADELGAVIRAWAHAPGELTTLRRRARSLYERDYRLTSLAAEWDRYLRDLVARDESPLPALSGGG
jgi:glycosyltransferase involved in cell wall biosynthesis